MKEVVGTEFEGIGNPLPEPLRRDIMQESTVYRSIWREAEEERNRAIAINLLRRGMAIDTIAPSTGLSIEEVQQLQQQLNESLQN
ncbi:hypothetical protein [Nostoc sp.]|uniref:hypothetical protein n=1 Tax=Nostoc sp. TaxID=1180 RepID=UPI002FF73EEB